MSYFNSSSMDSNNYTVYFSVALQNVGKGAVCLQIIIINSIFITENPTQFDTTNLFVFGCGVSVHGLGGGGGGEYKTICVQIYIPGPQSLLRCKKLPMNTVISLPSVGQKSWVDSDG